MVIHLVHELLCVALVWSCFCRSVLMDENVRKPVRLAFWFLGFAAIAAAVFPIAFPEVPLFQPNWLTVLLLLAIVLVQYVTAMFWSGRTPQRFLKDGHAST